MERKKEDGKVVMSICTPDLGITKKGYTTTQPSQPLMKEVVLTGTWNLENNDGNVSARHEGGNTVISAKCQHGQPVEFVLSTK